MNIILAFFLLFNVFADSSIGEEDRYVIHTMATIDAGDYIGPIIHDELDKAIEHSGKYQLLGEGRIPDLEIILSTRYVKNVIDEDKNDNPTAAISIVFVLFPRVIRYYAFSDCDVSDIDGIKRVVYRIMKHVEYIYAHQYSDALYVVKKIKKE